MRRAACSLIALAALVGMAGCTAKAEPRGRLRIVASFYPLAWAARVIAPGVEVEDLTPKGAEAHDLQLGARQRAAVQRASVVVLAGKGFQPDVERAAQESDGRVIEVLEGLDLLPSTNQELPVDPHVWLDPLLMRDAVLKIAATLVDVDRRDRDVYLKRGNELARSLETLERSYKEALANCRLTTLVTTHEAFGYLAKRFGLVQLGLTGLTPEAEPTASQILRAKRLAQRGEIAAVFYELSDEGSRIGRSVARDVGVPALPLNTLESEPERGDYRTEMHANLASLERGLDCR